MNREFNVTAPNQKWVTDVTEFSVGDRTLYLSPVMDLFDRQIISHTIGTSPNLDLTNTSLREGPDLLGTRSVPTRSFRTKDSKTGTIPGSLSSRAPERSNPCLARATATTTR
ncbi:DDE-type integrase/transposase/recombinase [Arthrobacter sp. M2012083]|uniref:DDE-type integrase/transposase/recombinase n=1 Tax=Arthrobacter sp. M2012083 TaxID=1197706 RepID=UPI00336AAD62